MKIKSDENIYIIPIENGICSIASDYLNDMIDCLTSYFVNRKKNKCVIVDAEDDLIKYDDVSFVYIPRDIDLKQIFEFKPKTLINSEFSEFIENNQEMFKSIEMLREQIIELLTDQGMYKLKKIMQQNLNCDLQFMIDDFDISRFLQSISIDAEELSEQKMYMALYNLLFYVNREKYCIAYIDFDVNEEVNDWLASLKENKNILLLIKNESIISRDKEFIDYMLIESNKDFMEYIEISRRQINDLIYCFHPYVLRNIVYQTEKNQSLVSGFTDKNTTFLIKFASQHAL